MNEKLSVEINRKTVTLTFDCQDDYAAIILYDSVCLNAQQGFVEIGVRTVPSTARLINNEPME